MKAFKKSSISVLALVIAGLAATPAAAQSAKERVEVNGQLTFQFINEDNKDLDASGRGSDSSFSEQAQVSVKAGLTDNLTAYTNVRALDINGDAGFNDDTGEDISNEQAFLELRELWLRLDNIGGHPPFSVQAGRQRVKEMRSLWWNSDFDMVRFGYDTTLLSGFLGLGQNLMSYRTGDDNDDFREEDEDRFRTLGEVAWQYRYNQFLEGRFLYEDDHSGLESAGSIIRADDRDNEDLEALWFGVRGAGIVPVSGSETSSLKYRADLIGLVGEEDELTSVAGPGVNQRTVTGSNDSDVRAWAFDGAATYTSDWMFHPAFTFGYAYGSGDDDAADGTDHAFRQSGLQGSSSRFGTERQAQKNYGEVLRPELSNLHIVTLGVGVPVTDYTDASLTYFDYHLSEEATGLRSRGITAPLNGTDSHIGQAADFVVNVDLDDQLGVKNDLVKDADFRVIAGTFFAGDAYEPNSDETAYRLFTELKLRF